MGTLEVRLHAFIKSALLPGYNHNHCKQFTDLPNPFVVGVTSAKFGLYAYVSKSFRTGRLERELQMVRLFATRCSCVAIFCKPALCEFCHHNPLCYFSTSVYCCLFRYLLSPETFGYNLVCRQHEVQCITSGMCKYTNNYIYTHFLHIYIQ
jgi:hypothetical protein